MNEIDKLHARIRELEDELASVRSEAVEAVEFWGEFASNYSKIKHGLTDDIASLRAGKSGASPSETAFRGDRDTSKKQNGPREASPSGRLSAETIGEVTRE